MTNMEIYEKVRSVPAEAQRAFNNGKFSGTDINPMWRIKKLTEIFGPAGFGWYYTLDKQWLETIDDVASPDYTISAFCNITLYVKMDGEWSKGIAGTGGNCFVRTTNKGLSQSDEAFKMALTDALSVACKALGIGADVYFEKDKTKYTDSNKSEETTQKSENKPIKCEKCGCELQRYGKLSPMDLAIRSKTKFGHILCVDCAKEIKEAEEMQMPEIIDSEV